MIGDTSTIEVAVRSNSISVVKSGFTDRSLGLIQFVSSVASRAIDANLSRSDSDAPYVANSATTISGDWGVCPVSSRAYFE
ncbi:hypothetical protein GCM10027444_15530 [Actinopolyspora lacussalsi]